MARRRTRGLSGGPEDHALAFEAARQGAMATGVDTVVLLREGRCEEATTAAFTHLLNQGAMEAHFRYAGGSAEREAMEGLRDIRRRVVSEFKARCLGGPARPTPSGPSPEGSGMIEF